MLKETLNDEMALIFIKKLFDLPDPDKSKI